MYGRVQLIRLVTSDLKAQQLSSMQSISEFGDSRRALRHVECCVHGRPCVIASKLSRAMADKTDFNSSSSSTSRYSTSATGIQEPRLIHSDISYRPHKKVEREALDVPVNKWNLRAPRSSASSLILEPVVARFGGAEQVAAPREASLLEGRARHKVERQSLSGTVDAPLMVKAQGRFSEEQNDNQYEKMDPVGASLASPLMSTEECVRAARTSSYSAEVAPSMEAYMGVMSARQAEEQVVKPTSFRLYHKMPRIESLHSVLPSLGLYIIYRSGKGQAYHYPIKECKQYVNYPKTRSRLTSVTNLQVEYGDPLAPRFFTLDALVSYYSVYVHLREVDGECVADIFPVDGMQPTSTSHRRDPPMLH